MKSIIAAMALLASPALSAELRIVSWNTAGESRSGTSTVLEAIGLETVNDIARPIDVLALQEQNTSGSDIRSILATLDGLYGEGIYSAAPTPRNANSSGAGLPGLIFNTQTIDLISTVAFGEVNTSAQARSTLRFELQADGFGEESKFFVYGNHYKASTGRTNQARRNVEAVTLRADLDALGDGVAAILTGDFNIRSSDEAMYQTLLADGPGKTFDPIDTPGNWHDAASFRSVHTQSPAINGSFNGQITAGIDDRFDFQLVTGELLDGVGLDYVPGSYRVFGNNGTHRLNGSITTGAGASPSVLTALSTASDHLPVVADYFLPTLAIVGDCNEDGVLTVFDANCTPIDELAEFLDDNGLLLGDTDGNGSIDFADFLSLRGNFGSKGQYTDGDFDKDGRVNFADFLTISAEFGKSRDATIVPEPKSVLSILFVALLWPPASQRRQGRRKHEEDAQV